MVGDLIHAKSDLVYNNNKRSNLCLCIYTYICIRVICFWYTLTVSELTVCSVCTVRIRAYSCVFVRFRAKYFIGICMVCIFSCVFVRFHFSVFETQSTRHS